MFAPTSGMIWWRFQKIIQPAKSINRSYTLAERADTYIDSLAVALPTNLNVLIGDVI